MRRPLLLAAVLLISGCSLNICAAQPIEGYWASDAGAVVQVTNTGSSYEGVVVQERNQGDCPEPVGDVLFKDVHGSGQRYTGQWQWWNSPKCERRYANATVDLQSANNIAHVCASDPFGGGSQCLDFKRVSKPSASKR